MHYLTLEMSNLPSKYENNFRKQIHDNIDGINVSSDDTVNSDNKRNEKGRPGCVCQDVSVYHASKAWLYA